jgi:hypothetical protein
VGPSPPTSPIQIAFGGKIYSGRYAIEGSTIILFYGTRKASTQLGGSPAISLAKILLREIVEADPKKF